MSVYTGTHERMQTYTHKMGR